MMTKLDNDANITVKLTDLNTPECILIEMYGIRVKMHTRSAQDLHHKLGLALLDWYKQAGEIMYSQWINMKTPPTV